MNDFIQSQFSLELLTITEVIVRAALALFFGLVLGWERDAKNKPIDFRAYMIICLTTCMLAIMGQEFGHRLASVNGDGSLDYGKIISGALTGIGFLGAGAIIQRDNNQIIGSATGASIWAAGGLGLIIGFGYYGLALISFLATAGALWLGGYYVKIFHDRKDKEEIDG